MLLALTPGEPGGIGPELILRLAEESPLTDTVVIADADMLAQRAADLGMKLVFKDFPQHVQNPGELSVIHVALAQTAQPGQLNVENAPAVLRTLETACDGCLDGTFDALVTGPVQKSIMNEAGFEFSGHTEFLAQRAKVDEVVMLLVAGSLRVALATTHVPLAAVPQALTQEILEQRLQILADELARRFAISSPTILVCGLNPHAGEAGHLGREEIEVISPVLERLRNRGVNVRGPLPADTLFTPDNLEQADAVMAMYHDQGLPVLKALGFGQAVNVTLGLPFLRTSVDHGTALDLAGSNTADSGSMKAAINLAEQLVRQTHASA